MHPFYLGSCAKYSNHAGWKKFPKLILNAQDVIRPCRLELSKINSEKINFHGNLTMITKRAGYNITMQLEYSTKIKKKFSIRTKSIFTVSYGTL